MLKRNWFIALVLFAMAALVYLPLAHKIGYQYDDWYLMFDAHAGGAKIFHEVYRIDRPLRGYLMEAAFSAFGLKPYPYHLSAYFFRVLSALGLFWLLEQLWEKNRVNHFFASVLFLLYPGFLSQVNPIDYQSQIFSLACGMFSVALTVKALRAETGAARWGSASLSILLGWVYLGLVEYFIGFEALRLAAVLVLAWRARQKTILARAVSALRAFLPFTLSAGGFLVWRLFFFESARKATDVGLQVSALFRSPLTALWQLNYLIQDALNVALVAWIYPLYVIAFPLRLREALFAFCVALLAGATIALALSKLRREEPFSEAPDGEVYFVAFTAIIAGLLPVVMVNRHIVFPDYSRYALASSVGTGILFAALSDKFSSRALRAWAAALLVGIAAATHYANAVKAVVETEATRNFWRQVAWRAPHIQPGTTLFVSYPNAVLSEDYFVWGPANFIYYPEKQAQIPVEIKLPAQILTEGVLMQILTDTGVEEPTGRGNYMTRDMGNILLIVQSQPDGCARFINGQAVELSPADHPRLFLVAPHSRLENVIVEGEFKTLPVEVFGEDPGPNWCYYYEQADLARQRGEWEKIPKLLDKALQAGYYPEDPLEWTPFLQAAAKLGDMEKIRSLSRLVSVDKFLRMQACELTTDFIRRETVSAEAAALLKQSLCKSE